MTRKFIVLICVCWWGVWSPPMATLAATIVAPAQPQPQMGSSTSAPTMATVRENNSTMSTMQPMVNANAEADPVFVPLENSYIQVVPKSNNPQDVAKVNAGTVGDNAEHASEEEAARVEDAHYWNKIALKQLEKIVKSAQKVHENGYRRKAKNIIIFVGDGMGLTTITAGRIFKGQFLNHKDGEEEMLSFDEFPYTGLAKTYNVDKQVPDSAGTATAMFCGSKTDYGAIGMDTTRSRTNSTQGRLRSIMDWAQAEGKRTGIVTTTRITHATPAATYARVYNRDWECDTAVPADAIGKHVDIARQLVENAPGNKFNVILGGGLQPMGARNPNETSTVKFQGTTESICQRGDNRNLPQEWLRMGTGNEKRMFVQTADQLNDVDEDVDHLMGLFRNNHITYSIAREKDEPSLKEMTAAAIRVLERGKKGFVLMVEGGRIDQAHHQNYARAAMREVFELDMAVEEALSMTDERETLIIVTADHSHSVTLNGYPTRGTDILGFANKGTDPVVYETITYANGPGYWDHLDNRSVEAGGPDPTSRKMWIPLEQITAEARTSPTYRHMATMGLKDETHGGEDVIVFANGPGSSLVRGVFEQNYLAYIMSYAGCMGPAKQFDHTCKSRTSGAAHYNYSILLLLFGAMLSLWRS